MKNPKTGDSEYAVFVQNLSKKFTIPHERINSLKGAFVNIFSKNSFESFDALQDVSFNIKKGEFFGIVGRNGSGKSTLLKILAGVYTPDQGKVLVNGLISPFLELGIGFNPELSGRDNVYLNATVLGLSEKEISKKFDSIVGFSELERFIDQKLKNYSSGMQVRLAFSVAIHANREILLLDEVLAVGDSNFQRKCIAEFEKYKRMGKTVIIVTHDTRIIEKYCDRAMLINNGRVMKVGAPTEIVMDYLEANISDEDRRIRKAQEAEHKKLQEQSLKKAPELQKEDVLIKKTLNRNLKSCIYRIYNHKGEETFALESGKSFQVKLEVEFSEDVRDLAFGVMFRSGVGKDLFGLHSLYSRKPNSVKEIKKGQKFEVSFQAEMILTQGTYPIYIGIASNVKYPNYDLVYSDEPDASIQVFSNDVFWGLVNSDFTSTIKQLGS